MRRPRVYLSSGIALCCLLLVVANIAATSTLNDAEAENAAARVSLAVVQRADIAADKQLLSANSAASALLAAGTAETVALTGYVDASAVGGLTALLPELRKSLAAAHPQIIVTTHPVGAPQTLAVVHAETRIIRQELKRDQATIAETQLASRRLTGLVDGAADSLDSVEKTSPSVLAANPLADAHSVDIFTSTVTAAAQVRPQAATPRSFALTAALLTAIHNYSVASAALGSSQSAAASE